MEDLTANEMRFVLAVLKRPEKEFNASSMARHLGMSAMGSLKIAKRLETNKILRSREMGKARFYNLDFSNDYARQYAMFLLKLEAEQAAPYVKRWITELRKLKNADCAVLFGSVLENRQQAKDIDVLLITDGKRFPALQKEIEELNMINVEHLHPLYQTAEDFRKNLRKADKPLLSAIKGIVAFGETEFIDVLERWPMHGTRSGGV